MRTVQLGTNVYQAFVYGRRLTQSCQSGILLHGIALEGKMAVQTEPLRVLSTEEAVALYQKTQTISGRSLRCIRTAGELPKAACIRRERRWNSLLLRHRSLRAGESPMGFGGKRHRRVRRHWCGRSRWRAERCLDARTEKSFIHAGQFSR